MKKRWYLVILALMILFVSACGKTDVTPTSSVESTAETTTPVETTPEETTTPVETTKPVETTTPEETTTPVVKGDITPAFIGTVFAGYSEAVVLDSAGKVMHVAFTNGNMANDKVSKWENITSIALGSNNNGQYTEACLLGVKADGTVCSTTGDFENWTDVVMIDAYDDAIVALKKDGTILSSGSVYLDKTKWQDIVQISVGCDLIVGLKRDKTVIATGVNEYGQRDVDAWTDVEMVSAGTNHVVGLRSNGTVLAAGLNFFGQCDVAEWKDIVSVAAGNDFTVGVKSDGTVVATGRNIAKRCEGIETWKDIVYVAAGDKYVLGVTKDGKLLNAGYTEDADLTQIKNVAMPTANFTLDTSKQLNAIEQKYIEFTAKAIDFDGEVTFSEPVNGILKGEKFAVKVPDDIAEKICYVSRVDDIYVYLKADESYSFDVANKSAEYRLAQICSIELRNDIYTTIACVTPETVLGDADKKKEINVYIHNLLEQAYTLAGKEYTYKDKVFVKEDGTPAFYGDELLEIYLENADKLRIDEDFNYHAIGWPSDVQISSWEYAKDYADVQEYFKTSAKIITLEEAIAALFKNTVSAGYLEAAIVDNSGKASYFDFYRESTVNEEVSKWENITSIAVGKYFDGKYTKQCVLGVKADGTVCSTIKGIGFETWTDVVMVDAYQSNFVALKKDGTVFSKGPVYIKQDSWQDIVQISVGNDFAVGLKRDKTVVASGVKTYGQCDVETWTDVELVSAGANHVVGLRSNGTVLATGLNFLGQCDVTEWKDIVFVAAGDDFTVGVKSDGTVIATGFNIERRCNGIENWTDVVYVAAGNSYVLGVTKDGQILSAGYTSGTDVTYLKNVALPGSDLELDFSKKLEAVEQKLIEFEVKSFDFMGNKEITYSEPENNIIKAEEFSFAVPAEMADKICYTKVENGVAVYLKTDLNYTYDKERNCIDYQYPLISRVEKRSDIKGLGSGNPEYLISNPREGVYYVASMPGDAQLSWSENAAEYYEAIEWFEKNVRITE